MRIKPPSAKHRRKAALRKLSSHYWLLPEPPKKVGRLGQLNKHNHRKPSEFVRTQKYGVTGHGKTKWRRDRVLTPKRLWLPLLEIGFGVYMTVCIAIALMWGFGFSTIPFLLIFAGGYFYVGFASLHALAKMNQEAAMEAALAENAEPAST